MIETLWNYADVAAYLRLKSVQAVRTIKSRDPSFPRSVRIGSRSNRFVPAEIRAWVLARRESNKTKRGRPAKAIGGAQ